jgi:hypothetical protein
LWSHLSGEIHVRTIPTERERERLREREGERNPEKKKELLLGTLGL